MSDSMEEARFDGAHTLEIGSDRTVYEPAGQAQATPENSESDWPSIVQAFAERPELGRIF